MPSLGLTAAVTNLAVKEPQASNDVPHAENEAPMVIQVQKGAPVLHELRNLNLTFQ